MQAKGANVIRYSNNPEQVLPAEIKRCENNEVATCQTQTRVTNISNSVIFQEVDNPILVLGVQFQAVGFIMPEEFVFK